MDPSLTPDRRTTEIKIESHDFELLPERCAYWKNQKTLLAADLHWGKAEVFQKHGLALPSTILDDDLKRLDEALVASGAERLLVLGDLIHAPVGITTSVIERVARWRARHPKLKFELIRGNHDRKHVWPAEWKIDDVGTEVIEGPFLFTHDELQKNVNEFIWAGHVHPAVKLGSGSDSLKLPCFTLQLKSRRALLPAFSFFTGGASLASRSPQERVFAITETAVIEV